MVPESILKYYLVANLLMFTSVIAQDGSFSKGYSGKEKDALYVLKSVFNNSLLNKNWTGIHCFNNLPPQWYGIQCSNGRVTEISLDGIGLLGEINVNSFTSFTELSVLSFKRNNISGNLFNFSFNQKLKKIDLSENRFNGSIPISVLSLKMLEILQIQDNKLTGHIPEFNLSKLKIFNVSNNNLTGPIPQTLQNFSFGSFFGNPGLCGPPSTISCTIRTEDQQNNITNAHDNSNSSSNSKYHVPLMIILLLVACLVLTAVLTILYYKNHRKLKKVLKQVGDKGRETKKDEAGTETETRQNDGSVLAGQERGKLIFIEEEGSFEVGDLLKASAEGLGKGMFGNSYKAMLEGRPPVVVKRLRDLKPFSNEEFTKQIEFIAKLRHPNLLPVLAYFYSKDEKLLLYKFVEKGNLFNRIHEGRGDDRVPFRWSARISAARGVAQALEYLHLNYTQSSSSIAPHGNLKSSNVLLDNNENVLISDYGLASLVAHPIASQRMVSYRSPEYQHTRKVSKKSDVWSYGCLLLELLTGKISSDTAPMGIKGANLSSWVHRAVREEWTAEIFDIEISQQRSATQGMLRLLQIAIRCCDNSPEKRPEMSEIVKEIDNIKDMELDDDEDLSHELSYTDDSMGN